MVRVVGFSFGNTTDSAVCQSMKSVESLSAQNSRSAVSLVSVGISFNFFGINSFFTFGHITSRNDPNQLVSDGKSDEEPSVGIGSPQGKKSAFVGRVLFIGSNDERQIKE